MHALATPFYACATRLLRAGFLLAGLAAGAAQAQCSSSGAAAQAPRLLVERFISADCADCWAQPSSMLAPPPSMLVLDWIAPGEQEDEAPLAAAALREATGRLAELRRPVPAGSDLYVTDLPAPGAARLRVGQGPAVADYLGVTTRFTPPARAAGPYRLTVVMAQAVPAGTEGTPLARNLARNVFESTWNARQARPGRRQQPGWLEVRSMHVPEGVAPESLRVLAWVHDGAGQLVAAAQTHCD